ncbi:MAG TPA: cytochrome c family protein, partial [Verrucomicrobiae bacterium]|nr:cytochrome c family protein [Verrucomicrobiae bacterium]
MQMKCVSPRIVVALALACAGLGWSAAAQGVQHLTVPQPGGMPGVPVMTGIVRATNGVALTWDGPSGYYQVLQKSNNFNAAWIALGKSTNLNRTALVTRLYRNAFFKVSGPAPKYAGAKACVTCHANVCRYETNTPHASAFSNPAFKAAGGQANSECLVCHTVGYGLPTGFVSASATPQLAGVQCENCHGPAANHAAAPDDPTLIPRVERAAEMCGGCHSGTINPTYDGWKTSGHAAVVPHVLSSMAASTNSIDSCGVCHSGSARLEFIDGRNPAATVANDYNVAITCAVCHNPHATNANPAQLRNPLASTNSFHFLSTDAATVSAFTNKYAAAANINLCAQ